MTSVRAIVEFFSHRFVDDPFVSACASSRCPCPGCPRPSDPNPRRPPRRPRRRRRRLPPPGRASARAALALAPPRPRPSPPSPGTFISLRSVSAASATSFLCSLRLSASSVVRVIWLSSLASTSLELSCHAASWSMISLSCPGRRSRPTGQLCTSNALLLWSSLPRSNPGAMHSLMSMSSSSRTLDISSADMSSSYGIETDASAI